MGGKKTEEKTEEEGGFIGKDLTERMDGKQSEDKKRTMKSEEKKQ